MSVDRMYCPSTDETIFAPDYEEIYESAEAFIAYWHGEGLDEPCITDPILKLAWKKYYKKWDESENTELDIWEAVEQFLKEFENPLWMVYKCTFHGMACGPTSTTVYYVVKADTIIEEDPNFDAEEFAVKRSKMTDEEITEEVLSRQIRAILKSASKENDN
jgi:hypothetical protein